MLFTIPGIIGGIVMHQLFNLKKVLGKDLQTSLNQLKTELEKPDILDRNFNFCIITNSKILLKTGLKDLFFILFTVKKILSFIPVRARANYFNNRG